MSDQKLKTGGKYGPHGFGDPEDRTLRKSEKNLLIPQKRRKIVREEYCPNEIKAYEECVLRAGLLKGPMECKDPKVKMAKCLEFWNDNDELQRRAREEYLQERSEYRRTGVSSDDRKFMEEYLQSKKQNQSSNS